jgi:hypothetical protein
MDTLDKDTELAALAKRKKVNTPKMIDNASLPAGSSMYYYCKACDALVAVKPESWFLDPPPKHCQDCLPLKVLGWI